VRAIARFAQRSLAAAAVVDVVRLEDARGAGETDGEVGDDSRFADRRALRGR
jgi:hypothetical protein